MCPHTEPACPSQSLPRWPAGLHRDRCVLLASQRTNTLQCHAQLELTPESMSFSETLSAVTAKILLTAGVATVIMGRHSQHSAFGNISDLFLIILREEQNMN